MSAAPFLCFDFDGCYLRCRKHYHFIFTTDTNNTMKQPAICLALLLPFTLTAQNESEWKEASAESQAYHAYRLKNTVPPYGLVKVKALVDGIKSGDDDNLVLNAKTYSALPLREKFTYHMIHAESYSQNCDVIPPIQDEHQKVMAHLPDAFDEYSWSQRQIDFLEGNRDSVIAIIEESANRSKRLGLNYKHAIAEIRAVEMIPFLIEFYKRDYKDHDILTVLLLLMKSVNYPPFTGSASYPKLYGKGVTYNSFIQYNKANEELICKRAMDLYNSIN